VIHIAAVFLIGLGVTAESEADSRQRIRQVNSWVYQLQKVDPERLVKSGADLLVIDHADDDLQPWPAETIERLKQGDGKRRIVLAYLSVGEAESYRGYWLPEWHRRPPSWIGRMNRYWRENYPVKYWHPEWQEIILGSGGYLEKIINQGFDGVYLDRLDVYTRWGPTGKGRKHEKSSAIAMTRFVSELAQTARVNYGRPNFLMVGQNAPGLAHTAGYLDQIDAIALEDIFHYGVNAKRRSKRYSRYILKDLLAPARQRGVPILAVDYLANRGERRRFGRKARRHGLIPFAAPSRRLDRLPK